MRVQSYADALAMSRATQVARTTIPSASSDSRARGKRGADRQPRPAERDRRRPDPRGDAADLPPEDRSAVDPHMALASTLARLALATVPGAQTCRSAVIGAYADTD